MVVEFAEIIKAIVNVDSPVRYLPAVEDDPQRRRPDIRRAKEHLNWKPKVSLENGLRKTIEYFRGELLRSSIQPLTEQNTSQEEKNLW